MAPSRCFDALMLLNHGAPLLKHLLGDSQQRCGFCKARQVLSNFSAGDKWTIENNCWYQRSADAVALFYFSDRAVVDVMPAADSHNSPPFTPASVATEMNRTEQMYRLLAKLPLHWNHISKLQLQQQPGRTHLLGSSVNHIAVLTSFSGRICNAHN